jgi:hypothetical protein
MLNTPGKLVKYLMVDAKLTYTTAMPPGDPTAVAIRMLPFLHDGSPHWKHSELVFERKQLIPALQQMLVSERQKLSLCNKDVLSFGFWVMLLSKLKTLWLSFWAND